MDDALPDIALVIVFDAEVLGILGKCFDLDAAFLVVDALTSVRRRHVVVSHSQRLFRTAHFAARHAQTFKGLRAGHFVNQMPVDIDQRGPVIAGFDNVIVPDLGIKCARFAGHLGLSECFGRPISGAWATLARMRDKFFHFVMETKGICG